MEISGHGDFYIRQAILLCTQNELVGFDWAQWALDVWCGCCPHQSGCCFVHSKELNIGWCKWYCVCVCGGGGMCVCGGVCDVHVGMCMCVWVCVCVCVGGMWGGM